MYSINPPPARLRTPTPSAPLAAAPTPVANRSYGTVEPLGHRSSSVPPAPSPFPPTIVRRSPLLLRPPSVAPFPHHRSLLLRPPTSAAPPTLPPALPPAPFARRRSSDTLPSVAPCVPPPPFADSSLGCWLPTTTYAARRFVALLLVADHTAACLSTSPCCCSLEARAQPEHTQGGQYIAGAQKE